MAYFSSLSEKLNASVRFVVPCAVIALLFIFSVSAITVPAIGSIKTSLFLMGIYYWAIYRPTLVPLWFVFIAGCLMDLMGATPLGFNALIFVLAQWSVFSQRRFLMGQSFLVIWVGFASICAASLALQWGIIGAINGQWFMPHMLFVSGALSIAIFPFICIILHGTHKILPAPQVSRRFGPQA